MYYIYEPGISRQRFHAQPYFGDPTEPPEETPESGDVGNGWDDTYGEDVGSGDTGDTEEEND